MAFLSDSTKNFSLYSIPVAWTLAIAPHVFAAQLAKNLLDPRNPRTLPEALKADQTIDKAKKEMILRAEAAQSNGFENLGLYAVAVLAGNMAGLPNATLNYLSGGYLASRALYNYVYINNTTKSGAKVRSLAYTSGIGIIFTLLIKAGNALRERSFL